jgi:hypothetical protein
MFKVAADAGIDLASDALGVALELHFETVSAASPSLEWTWLFE